MCIRDRDHIAAIEGSVYESFCLHIRAFLPYVTDEQLGACGLEELCQWEAKARIVEQDFQRIVTNGVVCIRDRSCAGDNYMEL